MKMSLHELDAEIREIEARIAAERLALDDAINGCTNSLRDTVASPKTLLALTGVGFGIGKLMFGRNKPQPERPAAPAKKAGVLGLLTGVAGTAFGLMQPKFGVGSVATWAAKRYFASRKKKAAAGASVKPVVARTAPLHTRP
jgi:hypothetical protein